MAFVLSVELGVGHTLPNVARYQLRHTSFIKLKNSNDFCYRIIISKKIGGVKKNFVKQYQKYSTRSWSAAISILFKLDMCDGFVNIYKMLLWAKFIVRGLYKIALNLKFSVDNILSA